MAKKFAFPKFLQRTAAEVEEELKIQEQRRAGFSRAHLTREEEMISRGALLEETARGNLDALQRDGKEDSEERERLAHALSLQGRFAEAKEFTTNTEMKTHYQSIVDAIEMDDAEKCNCEDFTGEVEGVTVASTPRFVSQEVFSQKHGKVVGVVTCAKCGHKNARTPNSRIPLSQSVMAQNRATAEGKGRGLIRDVELLKVK